MFSDDKKDKQKAVFSGIKTTVPTSTTSPDDVTFQSAPGLDLSSGGIVAQNNTIPTFSAGQGLDLATNLAGQIGGETVQNISSAVSQAQQVADTVSGIVGQGASLSSFSAEQGLDLASNLTSQITSEVGQKVTGALNQAQQAASMMKNLTHADLPVMKNFVSPGMGGVAGNIDSRILMKNAMGGSGMSSAMTSASGAVQSLLSNATGLQFTLTTPNLPEDTFAVASFTHQEAFSSLFDLTVELASKNPSIDFSDVLDENATLTVWRDGKPERSVTGVVSRFRQGDTGFHRTRYTMEIRPALWRTTLRQNSRIFQQETIEQILDTLMKDNGRIDCAFSFRHKHPAREFCVQYQESDFDFIQRLTAEEGIYYYFEFEEGKHRVVFTDDASAQSDGVTLPYNLNKNAQIKECCIQHFSREEQVRPSKVLSKDYTFKNPAWTAKFEQQAKDSNHLEYVHFDFPGRFKDEEHGKDFSTYRLEALRNDAEQGEGISNSFAVYPGERFILTNHPRQDLNKNWQVVNIIHRGSQPQALEEEGGEQGTTLTNQFTFMPARLTWRPKPLPKPKMDGPQIAKVVGPATEEIWTDKYGRVKLKFLWDQTEAEDDSSSCWIRVSQPLAGKGFGMVAIPRIGQEVIVDFLNGDPDQPVVTGRTYHASNMPSLGLPAAKTQMTLRSQTHKGSGFNELRFEDENGKQELFMHAQKDMNTTVKDNQSLTVEKGNRTLNILIGNETKTVHQGNLTETINKLRSTTANTVQVKAIAGDKPATQLYEAVDQIKLVVGSGKIVMTKESVTISFGGSSIVLNATGIKAVGPEIHLNDEAPAEGK